VLMLCKGIGPSSLKVIRWILASPDQTEPGPRFDGNSVNKRYIREVSRVDSP
jgi:hypothetical protein